MIIKIKKSEQFFFISHGILLFFSILSMSFYYKYFSGTPFKIIMTICGLLLILQEIGKFILTRKSWVGLLVCTLLFVLMVRVNTSAGQNVAACVFLYIYCARDIQYSEIAKFTLVLSSIVVVFVFISAYLGIITNYVSQSSTRTREFMGFRYALYPSTFMFNISCLYVYLRNKKIKRIECVILFIINYYIYIKTDSRLTFAMTVLLLLSALVLKYKPFILEKRKFIAYTLILSFLLCAGVSLYFTVTYNSSIKWMRELNSFLSGRLSLGQNSIIRNGVKLFGQEISWVGNGLSASGSSSKEPYTWVDNFYIQVLQRYGVFLFVFFLIIIIISMYELYKTKEYYLLVIMALIAVHCIIDDLSLYFYFNSFWIPVGTILIHSSKRIYKLEAEKHIKIH